jgi:hypothetical protein
MRVLGAAVMIALLAGPAHAQNAVQRAGEPDHVKTEQEKAGDRAAEKAYRQSLGNIPDKGPTDPWGIARDNSPPKAASKSSTKAAAKSPPAKPAKPSAAPN